MIMGRPRDPTILSGRAYVWLDGLSAIPEGRRQVVPLRSVEALISGCLKVEVGARRHDLHGVVLGSSLDATRGGTLATCPEVGAPYFTTYGVVAVGRIPGLQVEVGILGVSARERRWIASFGPASVSVWGLRLHLPPFEGVYAGVLRICPSDRRETVRKELFNVMRGAETTWRAPCP